MKQYMFVLLPCIFLSICTARMPAKYDDFYTRHKIWPMAQIFGSLSDPNQFNNITQLQEYVSQCFNSSEFVKGIIVNCDMWGNETDVLCSSAFAVSHDEESMILAFRATIGQDQINEQATYNTTVQFPGGGTVKKYYYNAFLSMWNAGMSDVFFTYKNKYPKYELWVTGWSMGSGIGTNGAAYISQMGYMQPENIKLVTFGQMRVGMADFAARYTVLVPYAYRVVHKADHVPHGQFDLGYFHIQNEIWYNNDMNEGDPYIECDIGESVQCSDSVPLAKLHSGDHKTYFGMGTKNDSGFCKRTP